MKTICQRLFLLCAVAALTTSCNKSNKKELKNEKKSDPTILRVVDREIEVNGKKACVYAIEQPDGMQGLRKKKGDWFNVVLENHLEEPTCVHWHGLLLPNDQDGVPSVTQWPILAGTSYIYNFPILQAGTFWMHSHYGLQEQELLAAPLILEEPEDTVLADQEVILLFEDFTFQEPVEIFKTLRAQGHKKMQMNGTAMKSDLIDVNYDAFLTNRRTLDNPDVIAIKPGKKVRLRLIDAASMTNFHINLGSLQGELIATDGNRIQPFSGSFFVISAAQRLDILITAPQEAGIYPILACGEGTDMQTGLLLQVGQPAILKFSQKLSQKAPAVTNAQEFRCQALQPLAPKPVDRVLTVQLGGEMAVYDWTINGQMWPDVTPQMVKEGQRVEIAFVNKTMMSHPMHLHGHTFQVTEIDGKKISGALRDTVLVMPNTTVKVQFDADNPGVWPLHCHLLYHQVAGMMTVVSYEGYPLHKYGPWKDRIVD